MIAEQIAAGLTKGEIALLCGPMPYRGEGAWRQWAGMHLNGLVDIVGDFKRYKVELTPLGLEVCRILQETPDAQ